MEKILIVLVLCVVVKASQKHHPKFPKSTEDDADVAHFKKGEYDLQKNIVACSSDNERIRNELIESSKCGPPKDYFQILEPKASYEQVIPGAVWVKRCIGLCDEGGPESKCQATKVATREIPVRIYSLQTRKEFCSTLKVVDHVSCGCSCTMPANECGPDKVLNPRKCSCQCPNTEERRSCLRKRKENMRWNRSKCICESRRKT